MFAPSFDEYTGPGRNEEEKPQPSKYPVEIIELAKERLKAAEEDISSVADPAVALKLRSEIELLKEIIS